MSVLDKMVAAVTPEPSDQDRAEVRSKALAEDAAWVSQVVGHHVQIEDAFAAVKNADGEVAQRAAQKRLGMLLTGHSIAEEAVLYPAMALTDQKGHSTAAYTEQSAAKVQMAALDDLQPLSKDYMDKLEHLRAAVAHHVYEEESKWFPELAHLGDEAYQARLAMKYTEQFDRYMGSFDDDHQSAAMPLSAVDGSFTTKAARQGVAAAGS